MLTIWNSHICHLSDIEESMKDKRVDFRSICVSAYRGSNLSTTGPLIGEGGKWPLWPGRRHGKVGGNMPLFFFRGVQHVYCAKFVLAILMQ